jgi:hypothetical protein
MQKCNLVLAYFAKYMYIYREREIYINHFKKRISSNEKRGLCGEKGTIAA